MGAGDFCRGLEQPAAFGGDRARIDAQTLKDRRDDPALLGRQRPQQVGRTDLRVAGIAALVLGLFEGLTGLQGSNDRLAWKPRLRDDFRGAAELPVRPSGWDRGGRMSRLAGERSVAVTWGRGGIRPAIRACVRPRIVRTPGRNRAAGRTGFPKWSPFSRPA